MKALLRIPLWLVILILILIFAILWWLARGDGEDGAVEGMTVFVTSQTYTGNLGGLSSADGQCQVRADAAGLAGSFKAWISGRENSGQDASENLTHATTPYLLVDGTQVAADWTDLTDGALDNAIHMDENGNLVPESARVWTNTTTTGIAWDNTRDCALGSGPATWRCDPTTECPFESGKYGLAGSNTASWTGGEASNNTCTNNYRLYCFQQ